MVFFVPCAGRRMATALGAEPDSDDPEECPVLSPVQNSHIETLAEGKLYALQNTYSLDGRVSSYPAPARGFSVSNCYLLKEPDAAVLIDTGYAAHEESLRRQMNSLLDQGHPLSLFPLRLNEFMSVNNVEAHAMHFNVVQLYSGNKDAALWFDFGAGSDAGQTTLQDMNTTLVSRDEALPIGSRGRVLDVFQAPIRLIGTRWMYDRDTKTLFTSDMFTHVWRDRPEGPWAITGQEDMTTYAHMRSFLLNTRYWWIEGIDMTPLRRAIGKVFEQYDIETIAPGYGAIIRGRDLVARQYQTFDRVLADLDKSVAVSRYVDRDEVR
jgi:hypothetical protein